MSNSLDFQYHNEVFKDKLEIKQSDPNDPIIAFPLPMINIDSSANSDAEGRILGTTYRIGLEGYIIAASTGLCTKELMAASVRLENFFKDSDKQGGVFRVGQPDASKNINDQASSIIISGVVFKDIRLDRSENNWTRYIPYSLSLEGFHAGSGRYQGYSITSAEDSWTIEQLDNISYFDILTKTNYKDYKSGTIIDTSKSPSENDLQLQQKDFRTQNILQYRITHRLGATGRASNTQDPNNPGFRDNINYAYVEAARWVNSRLPVAVGKPAVPNTTDLNFINTRVTGVVINSDTATIPAIVSELNLYNHIRSIDSNVAQGSYSLTDTWLALSSGIDFTEESTWEIVTDDKFVKTVNLNGTVYGLEKAKESGYASLNENSLTGLLPKQFVSNNDIATNKLQVAISGYRHKVKPYLYKRANIALSSIPGGVAEESNIRSTTNSFIGPGSNAPLNVTPTNYTESINANAGTVSYNVSYTNKLGSFLSGVLSSNMSIVDTGGVDQVAETFILGRALGPLLHKVGTTKTERKLNVEVVYPAPSSYIEAHPNSPKCPINVNSPQYQELKTFVDSFRPIAAEAFATIVPTSSYSVANQGKVFKTSESKTWNPFEGRYTWDVTWVYSTGICWSLT